MEKFIISEISESDYLMAKGSQKIINGLEVNFYYKLTININEFFIDSNGDISRFIIEIINDSDDLLFSVDDRIYIFSLNSGQIKFAMRSFEPVTQFRIVNDFLLIFSEKTLYKITRKDFILYSMETFSDHIENIQIENKNLTIICFDGNIFKIRI
jgi:hypothetical protein